jgi:hypothetical protein
MQECQKKDYLRDKLFRLVNGNYSKTEQAKGLIALHSIGIITSKQLSMYVKTLKLEKEIVR